VGLCELVQHLSVIDYLLVSGTTEGRVAEYVDHLHEHFVEPVHVRGGRYLAPRAPGFGAEIHPGSLERFTFPNGPAWRERSAALEPVAPLQHLAGTGTSS
jgi:L-fuconate dehydratase